MVVARGQFHGAESTRQRRAGLSALSLPEMTWAKLGTRQTRHLEQCVWRCCGETWRDRPRDWKSQSFSPSDPFVAPDL